MGQTTETIMGEKQNQAESQHNRYDEKAPKTRRRSGNGMMIDAPLPGSFA